MKLIKNFAVTTSSGLALIILIFLILNGILSDQIAVAIITAGATIFVATISAVSARKAEKLQANEQLIREKKTPIYEKIVKILFDTMKPENREKSTQIASKLREHNSDIVIWGTDDVILSWIKFREASDPTSKHVQEDKKEVLLVFEQLLYEIRKDLGHSNLKLKDGDLLKIFLDVKEVDDYLQRRKVS